MAVELCFSFLLYLKKKLRVHNRANILRRSSNKTTHPKKNNKDEKQKLEHSKKFITIGSLTQEGTEVRDIPF